MQTAINEDEAAALKEKLLQGKFDFNDFMTNLQVLRGMKGVSSFMSMIPGKKHKFKKLFIICKLWL